MMTKFLVVVGITSLVLIVIITFIAVVELVQNTIDQVRYKKRLKHRFDGGPMAECFCKDCKYYSEHNAPDKYNHGSGTCNAHRDWGVADNWFCWSATPRTYEEAKRREQLEEER